MPSPFSPSRSLAANSPHHSSLRHVHLPLGDVDLHGGHEQSPHLGQAPQRVHVPPVRPLLPPLRVLRLAQALVLQIPGMVPWGSCCTL